MLSTDREHAKNMNALLSPRKPRPF